MSNACAVAAAAPANALSAHTQPIQKSASVPLKPKTTILAKYASGESLLRISIRGACPKPHTSMPSERLPAKKAPDATPATTTPHTSTLSATTNSRGLTG